MAYKTKDLLNKAIKAIEENNLFFIEDIVAFLPCDKTTFYKHFPIDSNENNDLKELLEVNRVNQKVKLRKKWGDTENATLSLALYKLTGTSEERKRLSQTHHDLTSDGNKISTPPAIVFIDTDED
tara:strand:- start:81 stop:455 length:375 start_codon:yes stop_codon:yes gene_type:complete